MADASSRNVNLEQCPVRAFRSLRAHDVLLVKTMLSVIGGAWRVDSHDDYAGDLSLILTPCGEADPEGAFLLHRDAAGVHLADIRDESFVRLGTFKALSAALLRLRRHLAVQETGRRAA